MHACLPNMTEVQKRTKTKYITIKVVKNSVNIVIKNGLYFSLHFTWHLTCCKYSATAEEALAAALYVNEATVVQTVEGLVQHPCHLLLF